MKSSNLRTRYDTQRTSDAEFDLGRFQAADYSGSGAAMRFVGWKTPQPIIRSVASALYERARISVDQLHGGPLRTREGGPFLSLDYSNGYSSSAAVGVGTYTNRGIASPFIGKVTERYVGGFMPPPNAYFGSEFDLSDPGLILVSTNANIPSMTGLGDQAWSATKPKIEDMSAFQDVWESDQIPGQFTGTRDFVRGAREEAASWRNRYLAHPSTPLRGHDKITAVVGREFLNANFGWLPFLKSIYDLNRVIGGFSRLVKKFTKLNGHPYRRRVSLSSDEPSFKTLSVTQASSGSSYALPVFPQGFPATYYASRPHWSLTESVSDRKWAVGKWTFYRPEFDASVPGFDSAWNKFRQAMTIAGLRLTPSALYSVVPWTWLLDWFTNVGNYVDELTDIWNDQIVNHYCFVMCTRQRARHLTVYLPFHDGARSLTFTRVIVSKARTKGSSPFGFNLDASDLTLRQYSILAALQASRRGR